MGLINSTNKNIVDKDLLQSITIKEKIGNGAYGSVFHICIYKDCKYILK